MRRNSSDSNLFVLSYTSGPRARRFGSHSLTEEEEQPIPGVELDRISFINTALIADSGIALRTFFAPVLSLKRVLFQRQRLTQRALQDPAWEKRRFKEAIAALVRALGDASCDLLDMTLKVDENTLTEALRGKLVPAVYEPGAVLAYPGELPETMVVHIVLAGSARVVTYQPQNRKGAVADSSKRQYFVSNDTIRLGGSVGLQPELLKNLPRPQDTSTEGTSEVASTSNMSAAIQRSLRRASRMIGQPTLLPTRTEIFRAPFVACATEALGLEPHRLATVLTESSTTALRGEKTEDTGKVEVMQIRARDLHEALISMAQSQALRELSPSGPFAPPANRNTGAAAPVGNPPKLRDFIDAARVKSISRHYPLNEVLMRQSWLLQDTPAHTIRALVTQLAPRIFFPGEVILCPHTTVRQLCFLRRGSLTIEEPPSLNLTGSSGCRCAQKHLCRVLEDVPVGTSFGELSVLFGEPRQFVLRAKTTCDVWCLSHHKFAATVRRDDALRESLLSKAAALRMRWLGEQRFTATLARQLRESCELFREASDSFIRLVQERLEPHVYPPGTLLTSTSTRCEYMFIILQGRVSSIVDGVADYGPGSVLGEPTIIHHRWPIASVSKTMVEGWRLGRKDLIDALRRIEVLRQHSGKTGGQIPQMMQSIFRPPFPQLESDILGRSRMPIVEAPPRCETYMKYAQSLAEVQLHSICLRFRDLISWKDICYQTLPGDHALLRSASKATSMDKSLASDITVQHATKTSQEPIKPKKPLNSKEETPSARNGKGNGAARRAKRDVLPPASRRDHRPRTTASCTLPFYVNPSIVQQPFAHPDRRRTQETSSDVQDPFFARMRAIKATCDRRVSRGDAPKPQLKECLSLLEARDKLRRTEARHKQQHQSSGGDAPSHHVASPAAAAVAAALGKLKDNASRDGPAPVHIFLPRVQITVEEAVAVGFVLQFPDTRRIQSCVSVIDSDVTVGLPQHRQRRRDMAAIPNDRHYRHSFLFAASHLGERSAGEVIVRKAAEEEVDSRERAQHLTAVITTQSGERLGHRVESAKTGDENAFNAAMEWNGRSPLRSPAMNHTAPISPPKARSAARPATRETEEAFLQLMRENPDRALGSLRVRFHVEDTKESEESPDIIAAARGLSDAAAPRDEVLDSLRQVVAADLPAPDAPPAPPAPPAPRCPAGDDSAVPDTRSEMSGEKAAETEPSPLDLLAREDGLPLFVDGYGELGARRPGSAGSLSPLRGDAPGARGSGTAAAPSPPKGAGRAAAGRPQRFVMPDATEAAATMRRIQQDVEGLNAAAREQRRRRARLAPPAELPLGYLRLVDDWSTAYHENMRDPFALVRIPKQLLPEAGMNYLAQAYKSTRTAHAESDSSGKRDEHRDGNNGDARLPRAVTAPVGARKLGRTPRPLINPTKKMTHDDLERWTQERDGLLNNEKLPPAAA